METKSTDILVIDRGSGRRPRWIISDEQGSGADGCITVVERDASWAPGDVWSGKRNPEEDREWWGW